MRASPAASQAQQQISRMAIPNSFCACCAVCGQNHILTHGCMSRHVRICIGILKFSSFTPDRAKASAGRSAIARCASGRYRIGKAPIVQIAQERDGAVPNTAHPMPDHPPVQAVFIIRDITHPPMPLARVHGWTENMCDTHFRQHQNVVADGFGTRPCQCSA